MYAEGKANRGREFYACQWLNNPSNKAVSEQQALSLALLQKGKSFSTTETPSVLDYLIEKVSILDEAKSKLASEQALIKFASLASRQKEPFDLEKVSALQEQLATQGAEGYLQGLSPNALASSMLKGF